MRRNYKFVYSIRYTVYPNLGQSLIEVVVSVGIAVLLATALITTALITQKTARSAKNNTIATKLAQESVEKIRVFRDRNGFGVLANGSCYTLDSSNPSPLVWQLKECIDGEVIRREENTYIRKIAIVDTATLNNKLITVTVSWEEPSGGKSVSTQTILSQWNSPSPS